MRNKKAWVRILEAFIAIVLITAVFAVLYSRTLNKSGRGEQIYGLQKSILDEVASNEILRENILSSSPSLDNIRSFITSKVPPGFSFEIKICDINIICELDSYIGIEGKEIYSNERLISVTTTQTEELNPKILKIFMWEE
tara:strand:- start:304 stop:723 length:420 start_codon:yes stop_codon:yes gene_type:complete